MTTIVRVKSCFIHTLMAVTLLIVATPKISLAANHYVWCGATGAGNGLDFANATTDLPASLVRGDSYALAGSVTCNYTNHTFDDAESSTSVITIRKAQASTDSGVPGWQASFAAAPATWTDNIDPNPQHSHVPFWRICRSYYTFDGITGSTDPTAGPGGQGFVVSSPNDFGAGIIYLSTNGCGAPGNVTLSNITIAHTEVTGLYDYSPVSVTACSYAGGIATITTSAAPWPQGWVVGDTVAGFDSSLGVVFSAKSIATVPSLTTQYTVALASSPCAKLSNTALESVGTGGIYAVGPVNNNFSNLSLQYNYFHLLGGDIVDVFQHTSGSMVLIEHNWFERNRGTSTQHSQPIAMDATDQLTVRYNTFKNAQGTAALVNIGSSATASSNWAFYGNLVFDDGTTPSNSDIGYSALIESICTGGINTMVVYNNTIVNERGSNLGVIDSGNCSNAASWTVENNLWYGSPQVSLSSAAIGTHDYNTLLSTPWASSSSSNAHEYQVNSGAADPFVSIASQNFQLSSETVDPHLNDGLARPVPFNTDFPGNPRGADGTWDRGAYEFDAGAPTKPYPPRNLQATTN